MKKVSELTEAMTGTWNVQTETSSYIIDMDEHKTMRMPNTGAGIHPDHAENRIVVVNAIRGDGEWVHFDTLKQCMVGAIMLIYRYPNGLDHSTIVCKITKVASNDVERPCPLHIWYNLPGNYARKCDNCELEENLW